MMDLTIIIVSYNTDDLLKNCLDSVSAAIENLKAEVFVVDNHSADNTVPMVKKNFPWVNIIANRENVGFSKANNQAIERAKGRYILILNPDTEVMPDTFRKMINFMNKNLEVAVSTCKVELQDGSLDLDCRRRFPTPWRSLTHFSGLWRLFPKSKIFDQYYMGYISDQKEHEVDSIVGAFMLVRRSLVKKVGLFDEDFFFYGEDLDWCFRFKQAGYKIVYTPITKIIHHKGAASGMKPTSAHLTKATYESKKRALYESVHSMEIFYKKHYLKSYPIFVNWFVLALLKVLEKIRVLTV